MAEVSDRGPIPFTKMSGSGNDFVIMDGRDGQLDGVDLAELARRVCRRHDSVGADGLIVIERSDRADFRWQFFNSDGSRADMCGNGGRCAARFAHLEGIAPAAMTFETGAGPISAEVRGAVVKIQLTRPTDFRENMPLDVEGMEYTLSFVNTGVPHAVVFVSDTAMIDVAEKGRTIRSHPRFAPAGTNVNFVTVLNRRRLRVRTYERGVEAETKACGTGSVASVLVAWNKSMADPVAEVETAGGEILTVHIIPEAAADCPNVFLEGRTLFICRGVIEPEGYAGE